MFRVETELLMFKIVNFKSNTYWELHILRAVNILVRKSTKELDQV